ncbi:MAG: pyridoxal phosphate-dependent aminotransferase [bacterium]
MTTQGDSINPSIAAIKPSVTLSISAKAKELERHGHKVWNLSAGEPDCDTPDNIKEEAISKLREGQTKYTASEGLPALRKAIAQKLADENGLHYDQSQIIVSNGAKHSLFNVILAICGRGDEVIIPGPYWLSYPEMVSIAGAKPVMPIASEEHGFKITVKELASVVTPATKAIVINSPSNPTGAVYSSVELREIADFAVAHGLYIISDEIYEKNLYTGEKHVSTGALSEKIFAKTITVNGFSKAYSMTGWRLGYCAAPKPLAEAMSALQSHSTSGPCTFAQYGAIEALRGPQAAVATMMKAFTERRARMHERLVAMKCVTCIKPDGAFYMFPNISASGLGSVEFAERLLEEQKVAVVPGIPFGSDKHVRLSYACSMETIERGMDGMARFLGSL